MGLLEILEGAGSHDLAKRGVTDAHLPLQAFVRKPEALPDFFAELRSAWAELS